ncbi:MAG: hypothetical protein WCP31_04145 [Chloroflexales bacterium]
MNFRIQIVTLADDSTEHVQVIAAIPRGVATLDTIGLPLVESKHVLQQLGLRQSHSPGGLTADRRQIIVDR